MGTARRGPHARRLAHRGHPRPGPPGQPVPHRLDPGLRHRPGPAPTWLMAAGVRVGPRRPARIRTVNGERSRGRWHQPTVAAAGRLEDSAPVKKADSHSASLMPKIKDVRPAELVHAVRAIASGDTLLSPAITRRLLEEFVRRPPPGERPAALSDLTERESEVLGLVAQGLSNAEIAQRLFLGETTVKTHVTRVLSKLGVRDRVQAVVLSYESGLV